MLDEIHEIHPLFKNAPTTTEFKKLRKRIIKNTREAIEQYGMIEPGARWLVCMSGGKDSYTLLAALYELKWRGLLPVDILACNLLHLFCYICVNILTIERICYNG